MRRGRGNGAPHSSGEAEEERVLLAQGRYWEIGLARDTVSLRLLREAPLEAPLELDVHVRCWARLRHRFTS